MKNFKYILPLLILIFLWIGVTGNAQEWTEPVEVSDIDGAYLDPDMCIDNNGVIHVVWAQKLNYNYWKIMYSKSENNGETWSEDFDISQNDTLALLQPHIATDNINNLYVTYDYNAQYPSQMSVFMKMFDGSQWGDSILITEGMPGSDYNKVFVDDVNRAWVFWAINGLHYYRYFKQGILSEIMEPFFNTLPDYYYPYFLINDTSSNLHWVGYNSENFGSTEYFHTYFLFNYNSNTWNTPYVLTSNLALIGNDIALNSEYLPAIAIRERTEDTATYDATLYMNNDGQQWLQPELIVEDPENQQIAIDQNNKVHVINREKTITGYQIVHYQKINNEWIGYVIDSTTYFCHPAKLLFKDNQLFLTYYRNYTPGYPDFNIMFTKYDITTKIINNEIFISKLTVYPNPSVGQINISFELSEPEFVNMLISDFSGRHIKTVVKRKMQKGKHIIYWNGENEQGVKVKNGLYLCRLYCGRNVITKSIEIIN